MICFGVGRDYTGLFYDRPLDRPPTDGTHPRLVDLRNAIDAGFDAISVDLFILDKNALPAFQQLVDLIKTHNLPIGLTPFFDGFGNPALTDDDVVDKVNAWFDRFGAEPCVVRTKGKPVVFAYNPSCLSAGRWQRIFGKLRAAGCDGHWIMDGGGPLCLGDQPKFDAVGPWLGLFDGAYTFAPGAVPARPMLNARLYHERYGERGRFWTGSTKIGYWRPEIAVYTSPEGTAHYRRSWDAIRQARIPWVQHATWNDFSENHGIMPSANNSTTFVELTRTLIRDWKGLPAKVAEPRLFLGRMREVQVGEESLYEMLALLPTDVTTATFEFELLDGAGTTVYHAKPRTLAGKGLLAPHFQFPVSSMPKGRVLVPKATLQTPGHDPVVIVGAPSIVSPADFLPERCYSWVYTPAHRQLRGVTIRFSINGASAEGSVSSNAATGKVAVQVASPVPILDVEVLRRGLLVCVMRRRAKDMFPSTHVKFETRLPLNRLGQLGWGFYEVRVTTTDRRVAVSRPVFVDPAIESKGLIGYWPFDEGVDYRVLDQSPWLRDGRLGARTHYKQHQPTRVPDRWGGKCVRFDGVDDRIQMDGPVVPARQFTVECWAKPASCGWPNHNRPATIFATANADCVVSLDQNGILTLSRKAARGWVRVRGKSRLQINAWAHIAVTFDGATVALFENGVEVGARPVVGTNRISRFGIGFNTVTRGSFFHGCIDDVRIHQRVLEPHEFGPHCPLVAR